jgi:hypothetical protein
LGVPTRLAKVISDVDGALGGAGGALILVIPAKAGIQCIYLHAFGFALLRKISLIAGFPLSRE